jgi:integrase
LAGKQLSRAKSTSDHYKKAVTEFLSSLGGRAEKSLGALTPEDIERFRDARFKQGVSAAVVRYDLQLIRSVLSTARRQALIIYNPAETVDLPRVKTLKRDVFTQAEVRMLLEVAPPDWRTAILVAFYTGPRLGDVVSLRWDQVDFSAGLIFYTQGKTGKEVEVPLHPDLEEHLPDLAGDNPHGFLSPTLAGQPIGGAGGLSTQFAALMAKAGIDQRRVQSSRNRQFSRLSFHSLRHSFSSALANAGISADVRMKLTGHKSVDVHRRYTHIELAPLKEAIATLPSL